MTSMPLISVIIVNYNGGSYLQEAVQSLSRQTFRDFELILADNASTDGSMDGLQLDALPEVHLIRNEDNLGFAVANNRAAATAKGKWIVLLNPDCSVTEDWLASLVNAAQTHPDCKTFTSAQYNLDDKTLLDGTGDAYFICGFPWRGGFGRPASELPESGWCFSACGAGAMYDRELFQMQGGFDERFFCYCEDVDLGFRLQLLGHDCRFVREAVIYHAGSGISGRESPFTTYHGTRNRVWTYVKNMPLPLLIMTLPGHVALSLYLLIRNIGSPRFKPMWKGLMDGAREAFSHRRASLWRVERQSLPDPELVRRMAWNPLRLSRRKPHIRPDT